MKSAEGTSGDSKASTPRSELEKLRAQQRDTATELRSRIIKSMLICCGEVGYQRVAVERVYKLYGGYRSQFYRFFSSKADCYLAAYEEESERIYGRLSSYIEETASGVERMEAALRDLAAFISEEPAVARALILEVHVAGGQALDKRHEVFSRLAKAIDAACRLSTSPDWPPPTSGLFVVGAIEEAVAASLIREKPEELTAAVPELADILFRIYSPA